MTDTETTTGNASRVAPPAWYADPADQRLERWWDGRGWTEYTQSTLRSGGAAAVPSEPTTRAAVPAVRGRVSGFVFSLIAFFMGVLPILGIPLAVVGIAVSTSAMRRIPAGTPGRGLAIAGVVIGWTALVGLVSLTLRLASASVTS